MRCAEQYAVEFGFVRCSSRLSRSRPRACFFAKDYPCSRSDPAWPLYWAFSSSFVPLQLAVEPYRPSRGPVEWTDLTGAMRGRDGFVKKYVSRVQALCQLFVQFWLAPAVRRLNRAMLTQVAVASWFVRFKMICVGSRPEHLYERPPSDPWRYTTALDNVAGTTAFGSVRNFEVGAAPNLCV